MFLIQREGRWIEIDERNALFLLTDQFGDKANGLLLQIKNSQMSEVVVREGKIKWIHE